jgi:PTS system nitrogen regulatory IIA component
MELADILSEESVLVCSGLKTKLEVLRTLSERAARVTGESADAIFAAVNDREELGSTGLGNGIAIPHGKFSGIKGVTALFARLDQPVEFDSVDDRPVDLLMLLLAPMGAGADHLKALARVARILRTESVVEQLRSTDDVARLYAILTQKLAITQAA